MRGREKIQREAAHNKCLLCSIRALLFWQKTIKNISGRFRLSVHLSKFRLLQLQHVDLDTTRERWPRHISIVRLSTLDNVIRASHVPVKPSNQTRVMRVSCPEDCGGGSKVANAEHTACGKLVPSMFSCMTQA